MSNFEGKQYHQTAILQFHLAQQLLNNYSSHFSDINTILDIGCGDGAVTSQLKQFYPHSSIEGIDPSSSMINFANEHYATPELQFRQGAVESLNEKNKYDLIVSFSVLQWTILDKAFIQIAQALKPERNCLLMYYPCNDLIWMPVDNVCRKESWKKYFENYKHQYHFYDIDDSIILAKMAGLEVIHAASPWFQLPLKDLAAYENSLSSYLPHLSILPDLDLKKQFLAEISDEFKLFSHKNADGFWILPGRTIEIIARSNK